MIEKKLIEALEPVIDDLVSLEKRIDAIQLTPGKDGVDGAPGRDGADADPAIIAKHVAEAYADVLRGLPGSPGKDGADGKDAAPEAVAEVLVTKHADVLRGAPGAPGRDGSDGIGIKAVKVDDEHKTLSLTLDDNQEVEIVLPEGPQGEAGAPGRDGSDGLGIETKAWEPGIYREGSFVTAEIGRVYKAVRDTNAEPGKGDDWARVGSAGFAWKGLKDASAAYENGDLYIDGGSAFIWWNGKGRMFSQRGAKGDTGPKGADGKDGLTVVAIKADGEGFHLAMSDGSVMSADVEGLEDYVDAVAHRKTLNFLEAQAQAIEDEGGTPFRSFMGQYIYGRSYSTGDVVRFNKSLWIAKQKTRGEFVEDEWRRVYSGGGGGGGGGAGGITRTSQLLADGMFSMAGFGITGLSNPRNGAPGALDAVNQQTMQAAIAAGALYQGPYKPAGNLPNLGTTTDSSFRPPAAGDHIGKPTGATQAIGAGNIAVWFEFAGHGLDTFPASPTAPVQVQFTLSDGTIHSFNIPVKAYANLAALQTEIDKQIAGLGLVGLHAQTIGGKLWLVGETAAPKYMTSITGQTGGGFPMFAEGPGNTALNTYNWVVSTVDPNVPEYAPPGIPGVAAGTKLNNSDLLQWNATLKRFDILRGGNLTQNFADNRYWQLNFGNMKWSDQPYQSGAIVYGQRFNAWFVATQNIVQGSAEPGTTAAGAIWRKINSTYGSTIFFGKGDFDTAAGHQDAAHNWGMPAGTYPAGQQPLNGDSYFDVLSGTEAQFSVTQNAPIFTLTGQVGGTPTDQQGATLGNADLAGWPGGRSPMPLPAFWQIALGAAQTPTTGAFAGKTFAAGTYLIGYSGDPDADNGGWFMVADVPVGPSVWTINTPHAQARPDTVTANVVWGYRRNFVWAPTGVAGATEAAPVARLFVGGFSPNGAIYRITVTDRAANGAVYELLLSIVSGQPAQLSIVSVRENAEHFILGFGTQWDGSSINVGANVKADAINGRTFDVVVQSVDGDMGRLVGKTGGDTAAIDQSAQMKQFGAVAKVAAIISVDRHTYGTDDNWDVNAKVAITDYVANGHGFRVTFGVGIIKYHDGDCTLTYGIYAGTNPDNITTQTHVIPGGGQWRYAETYAGISGAGTLDGLGVKVKHTSGGGNADTRANVLVLIEDLGDANQLNQIPATNNLLALSSALAAGVYTVTHNNGEKEKAAGTVTMRLVYNAGGTDVTVNQTHAVGDADDTIMGNFANNMNANHSADFTTVNTASTTNMAAATRSFTLTPKAGKTISKFELSVVYP